MKKAILCLITMVILCAVFASCLPVSAADSVYDLFKDGEVMYTPNFNGDSVFAPALVQGQMTYVVDPVDTGIIKLTSGDKGLNYWGGEITNLPLNETTAYTIFYTATRKDVDSCLGFYPDCQYGVYGYSYNQRFVVSSKTLEGRSSVKYLDKGMTVEGDNFATNGNVSIQRYALEVNGQKSTLKIYVMSSTGEWLLFDETTEGEIPFFYREYVGLFFYIYNAAQSITVSDISVVKGMSISKDIIEETTPPPATTPAPVTTAVVTTAKVTTAKVTTATAPVASTTATPGTTAPAKQEAGCGKSSAVYSVLAVVLLGGAVFVFGKKH